MQIMHLESFSVDLSHLEISFLILTYPRVRSPTVYFAMSTSIAFSLTRETQVLWGE